MKCPLCKEGDITPTIQDKYEYIFSNIIIYGVPSMQCSSNRVYLRTAYGNKHLSYLSTLPDGFSGSYEEACKLALREKMR